MVKKEQGKKRMDGVTTRSPDLSEKYLGAPGVELLRERRANVCDRRFDILAVS